MVIRYSILNIAWILMATFELSGQNFKSCERDYTLLKARTITQNQDFEVGEALYLSPNYLSALRAGKYESLPSGLRHYEYIRDASRKEMRATDPALLEADRRLVEDAIYSMISTPPGYHFFMAQSQFSGNYTPTWEDPVMVLPVGLEPIDIRRFAESMFFIKAKTADYLLLEAQGEKLVFYLGYPDLLEVFEAERVVDRMIEKQAMANALVGSQFLVANHPSLRYRVDVYGPDLPLPSNQRELAFTITRALATHHEVLLAYEDPKTKYLVLDEAAAFILFDMDCLEEQARVRRMPLSHEDLDLDVQLLKLLSPDSDLTPIFEKADLIAALENRFELDQHPNRASQYHYRPLSDRSSAAKCHLSAQVGENGDLGLISFYAAEKGIYHTRVDVFINGETYSSERVPTLDPRSKRGRQGNWITECIQFGPGQNQVLLEAIARNADQPITIRFNAGGSFYQDMPLTESYKQAIRDSWLFSQILLHRNGPLGIKAD